MNQHQDDPQNQAEQQGEGEQPGGSLMSLMSGTGQTELGAEFDEAAESRDRSPLASTGLVVAFVAVVAVGALVAMRATQTDPLADGGISSEVQSKVDAYLGRGTGQGSNQPAGNNTGQDLQQFFEDTDAVLAIFSRDLTDQQVPIEYVKKNPFELRLPGREQEPGPDQGQQQRQRQLAELQRQREQLRLQSVVGGSNPVATINGQMYRPGDTVGPFTIRDISGLQVTLRAMDHTWTLSMDDE